MRLDKYLKVSRLVKRRTLAKDICDAGKVLINDKTAKASSEVKLGDKLSLNFGHKTVSVEIIEIKENVPAARAQELYNII